MSRIGDIASDAIITVLPDITMVIGVDFAPGDTDRGGSKSGSRLTPAFLTTAARKFGVVLLLPVTCPSVEVTVSDPEHLEPKSPRRPVPRRTQAADIESFL